MTVTVLTSTTHRERIRKVFRTMREMGFVARMNFMCCGTCAMYEIAEQYGDDAQYVFWHNQADDAFDEYGNLTSTLYMHHNGEQAPKVCQVLLAQAGLTVEWDGTNEHTLEVKP